MQHYLRNYIDYYLELDSPQYAILVTGAWGVGKTHQVRKLLPECRAHYVSLFGLTTVAEIHDAVFTEVEPTLATARKYIPTLLATLSSAVQVPQLNSVTPGLCQALLRKKVKPEKVLIFDDLERCTVASPDLLGAINTYVEHHRCKVIVIAHDEKLVDGIRVQKEKLFGHTVRVFPQVDEAFSEFLTRYNPHTVRSFLSENKAQILSTFTDSQCCSLRLLRAIMDDLSRLHSTLTEEHLNNGQAMKDLISLHTPLNLEVRSGHLKETDLAYRSSSKTRHLFRSPEGRAGEDDTPAILRANRKYKDIDICDNFLNDEVILEMLIHGVYSTTKIRHSIDNSAHFLKVEAEETPSWKLVYRFDQLEDDIVAEAQRSMEDQFRRRTVENPDEFLHIFALLMMMSEQSIIEKSLQEIFEECKMYVDDLAKDRRLPRWKLETEDKDSSQDIYDGFQYWVTDTYEAYFGKLKQHIAFHRQAALESSLSDCADALLQKLRGDAVQFAELISYSPARVGRFAANAILHNIDPKNFVSAWLGNEKKKWHYVKIALEERYARNQVFDVEHEWVKKVIARMEELAKVEAGLRAFRIRRVIPRIEHFELDRAQRESESG